MQHEAVRVSPPLAGPRRGLLVAVVALIVAAVVVLLVIRDRDRGGESGSRGPAPIGPVVTAQAGGFVEEAAVGGVLVRDGSCLYTGPLGSRVLLIWPSGTEWDESDESVRSGDVVIPVGGRFRASGGYGSPSRAMDLVGDERAAQWIDSCAEGQVAIMKADLRSG